MWASCWAGSTGCTCWWGSRWVHSQAEPRDAKKACWTAVPWGAESVWGAWRAGPRDSARACLSAGRWGSSAPQKAGRKVVSTDCCLADRLAASMAACLAA